MDLGAFPQVVAAGERVRGSAPGPGRVLSISCARRGFDSPVGDLGLAVDALGVDLEQDVHAMSTLWPARPATSTAGTLAFCRLPLPASARSRRRPRAVCQALARRHTGGPCSGRRASALPPWSGSSAEGLLRTARTILSPVRSPRPPGPRTPAGPARSPGRARRARPRPPHPSHSPGALRWSFTAGDSVHSSPAVVGGVVYFGSRDENGVPSLTDSRLAEEGGRAVR